MAWYGVSIGDNALMNVPFWRYHLRCGGSTLLKELAAKAYSRGVIALLGVLYA